MMTQSKKDYFYHGDSIRTAPKDSSVKKRNRFYDQEDRAGRVFGDAFGANAGSVWHFSPYNQAHGKASMPVDLATRCIQISCDDNSKSVVLDMFGGTGTTALAAVRLGHSSIYIDINFAYRKKAEARIRNETQRT
jgi:DNA modification methylase